MAKLQPASQEFFDPSLMVNAAEETHLPTRGTVFYSRRRPNLTISVGFERPGLAILHVYISGNLES